jgi:hypothetical protein
MVASSAPPRSTSPGPTDSSDPGADGPTSTTGFGLATAAVAVGALLLLVALAAPRWFTDSSAPSTGDRSEAMRRAEDWIADNIGPDDHLVLEASAADDLLGRGISDERLIAIEANGPAPDALTDWRRYDFLVSSPLVRSRLGELPSVQEAVDSSRPVARFGADDELVEIRRILPGGMDSVEQQESEAQDLRLRAGASLAQNPNLTASADAVDALRAGQVDERLLNVIATLVVQHHLQVGAFPVVDGEEGIGAPRRIVEIDGIDFRPIAAGTTTVASLEAFLDSQLASYRPIDVAIQDHRSGSSSLRITYAVAVPNR